MHLALFLLQNQPSPADIQRAMLAVMTIFPIFMILGLAIVIIPCWFVCKKAGFSPWLSLLNIVPFGTLILLYVLAFAEWKVAPVPTPSWQVPPPYPPQA